MSSTNFWGVGLGSDPGAAGKRPFMSRDHVFKGQKMKKIVLKPTLNGIWGASNPHNLQGQGSPGSNVPLKPKYRRVWTRGRPQKAKKSWFPKSGSIPHPKTAHYSGTGGRTETCLCSLDSWEKVGRVNPPSKTPYLHPTPAHRLKTYFAKSQNHPPGWICTSTVVIPTSFFQVFEVFR